MFVSKWDVMCWAGASHPSLGRTLQFIFLLFFTNPDASRALPIMRIDIVGRYAPETGIWGGVASSRVGVGVWLVVGAEVVGVGVRF